MPKVKEIMKSHVITIGPEVPMSKIAKILTNNRVGSVVIVRDDKPVNIITTNDIVTLVAHGKDLDRISAEKYIKMMKKPLIATAMLATAATAQAEISANVSGRER